MTYTDYRFRTTDLPRALTALDALRAAGILAPDEGPANMLGDPVLSEDGIVIARARRGRAAIDTPDGEAPAIGDPAYWYIAIRSTVAPADEPVDPAAFGMEVCDAAESAAVLGAWA